MRDNRHAGNAPVALRVYLPIISLGCHYCVNLIGEMLFIILYVLL
jgi:hypothetical protein